MNNQVLVPKTESEVAPQSQSQSQVVIKRYQNRKLYNTETSQYLTLEEIAVLIKDGRDIRVIDNKTKQDITSKTLVTYCCEQELKNSDTNIESLTNIIKNHDGQWSKAMKAE